VLQKTSVNCECMNGCGSKVTSVTTNLILALIKQHLSVFPMFNIVKNENIENKFIILMSNLSFCKLFYVIKMFGYQSNC